MGSVAQFPDFPTPEESTLKQLAFEQYCSRAGRHIGRISKSLGIPLADIERWANQEKWSQRRAAFRAERNEATLAELLAVLKQNELKNSKESALSFLKFCDAVEKLANKEVAKDLSRGGVHPPSLLKLTAAMERVQKIRADAYTVLDQERT